MIEFKKYFIINTVITQHLSKSKIKNLSINSKKEIAKPVPHDFEYNSLSNINLLNINEIKKLKDIF